MRMGEWYEYRLLVRIDNMRLGRIARFIRHITSQANLVEDARQAGRPAGREVLCLAIMGPCTSNVKP
jgi:hypothetical protein